MSEARAITNFIGNGVAAIFLANNEKEFNRNKMTKAFSKEIYEYDLRSYNNTDSDEAKNKNPS